MATCLKCGSNDPKQRWCKHYEAFLADPHPCEVMRGCPPCDNSDFHGHDPASVLPVEAPSPMTHGMNCPGLIPGNEEACTCGLEWKIALQTEGEMHTAWRKRAEEAEKELSDAKHEASCRDDIKLDQPLAGIIADLQAERERLSKARASVVEAPTHVKGCNYERLRRLTPALCPGCDAIWSAMEAPREATPDAATVTKIATELRSLYVGDHDWTPTVKDGEEIVASILLAASSTPPNELVAKLRILAGCMADEIYVTGEEWSAQEPEIVEDVEPAFETVNFAELIRMASSTPPTTPEKIGTCKNADHNDFGIHAPIEGCIMWEEEPATSAPTPDAMLPLCEAIKLIRKVALDDDSVKFALVLASVIGLLGDVASALAASTATLERAQAAANELVLEGCCQFDEKIEALTASIIAKHFATSAPTPDAATRDTESDISDCMCQLFEVLGLVDAQCEIDGRDKAIQPAMKLQLRSILTGLAYRARAATSAGDRETTEQGDFNARLQTAMDSTLPVCPVCEKPVPEGIANSLAVHFDCRKKLNSRGDREPKPE
jgi:hypothetical protein